MLRWLAVAGDGLDESAWARAFQISCQLPSLGQLAPPGPVKLPSRTPSGARALDSFWAASCAPHSHPLVPPFAGIGPAATKSLRHVFQGARWLQVPLGVLQVAVQPTRWHRWWQGWHKRSRAAADGRKVLSGDRGDTCSGQDGFSGAQDRNMTVLGAAGAPSSRKKILLRSL